MADLYQVAKPTSSRDDDPLAAVEPERAARIRRALRRGEALTDPDDAALAVAAAETMHGTGRKSWWILWLVDGAVIAVAIAAAILSILSWTFTLIMLALAIPGLFVTFVFLPHLARQSAESARRNRALLETFGSEGEEALRRAGVGERRRR